MMSRSITGLVLAALLAAPAAASAQGFWLGGLFGAEFGKSDGFQLRFDGEVPIARITPRVQVSGVLSASYSGLEHDLTVFEVVPAARVNWTPSRTVGAYFDLGLGLAYASVDDQSDTGATMRFGAGLFYQMSPRVRFPVEFAIHPHFGDYDQTTTTIMIGARFKL
jgi:hypothetical protein